MADTRGKIKEMTEDDLDGFDLKQIACRSCSGYGNCGFKTYGILNGNVVSICNRRKSELEQKRAEGLDTSGLDTSEVQAETQPDETADGSAETPQVPGVQVPQIPTTETEQTSES